MKKQAARPRVIANFAITADGKVSTRNFTSATFTSPADKRHLLEIRALGDGILVGAGTLRADTMSMGLPDRELREKRRRRGLAPEPLRIIVSNRGSLDPKAKVFQKQTPTVIVFSTRRMPARKQAALAPLCDLWLFDADKVDMEAALKILRSEYKVKTLICEGGPTLFRSLLERGLVDELRLTWAPVVFGGAKAPTLTGLPGDFLPRTVRGRLKSMKAAGGECFLVYEF